MMRQPTQVILEEIEEYDAEISSLTLTDRVWSLPVVIFETVTFLLKAKLVGAQLATNITFIILFSHTDH